MPAEFITMKATRRGVTFQFEFQTFRNQALDSYECGCVGSTLNASGALSGDQRPLEFDGSEILAWAHDERFGPQIPDMSEAYSRHYSSRG